MGFFIFQKHKLICWYFDICKNQVVSDVKDTKFESNSQHLVNDVTLTLVVSDVKDTKFESNSQPRDWCREQEQVVSDVKDTKFESNSQRSISVDYNYSVVSDVKDTKFESNSQLLFCEDDTIEGCFWCQRYKIWKQFTTREANLFEQE